MRPIIGITPSVSDDERLITLNVQYCDAIEKAGGIPFIISYYTSRSLLNEITNKLDGLLISGGYDISPHYYGESPSPKLGKITPSRDSVEIELCNIAISKNIPLLGICRGIQTLSVALCGTLYQDIYSETQAFKHSQDAPKDYASHSITINPESMLKNIFSTEKIYVNSFHHQSVKKLPCGFIASAHSDDGIIEAIEHTSKEFILGVQWHPECMFEKHAEQFKLFEAFVKAAAKDKY